MINLPYRILLTVSLLFYSCAGTQPGYPNQLENDPQYAQDSEFWFGTGQANIGDASYQQVARTRALNIIAEQLEVEIKSGGNYSTSHNEESGTEVWPNSGSWTFQNEDKNKVLRNDGVVVSISATETTLRTSFTVSGGIKDGNWVFNFVKQ